MRPLTIDAQWVVIALLSFLTNQMTAQSGNYTCGDDEVLQPVPDCKNGGTPVCEECLCPVGYNGQYCETGTDCGELLPVSNGQVQFNLTDYLSKATYLCDDGYGLVGTQVRTCLGNQSWSDEEPSCLKLATVPSASVGLPVLVWGIIVGVLAILVMALLITNIIACCKVCKSQARAPKNPVDWPDVTTGEVIENLGGVALSQEQPCSPLPPSALNYTALPSNKDIQHSLPYSFSQNTSTVSLYHPTSQGQPFEDATTQF